MVDPLRWPPVVAVDAAGDRTAARLRGHRGVDRAMYGITEAANHSMLWHAVNLADAATSTGARRKRALRRSVIIALEQAVVNGPVKTLVGRTRPIPLDDHPHRLRAPRTSSFPSGHASAGACAATLLSRDHGAPALWWSLAGTVAWSRVHVGVHHASDIAGGAIVGHVLARVAARLWPPPEG